MKKSKTNILCSLMLLGAVLLLTACSDILDMQIIPETKPSLPSFTVEKQMQDIASLKLRDMDELYKDDVDTYVKTMYLTVKKGNASEGTDHTWEEINTYSAYYYQEREIDRYKVAGILRVGDENGPIPGEFGFDENAPNVTVQIRGQTSSRNAQKNYRISIRENKGTYQEQKVINLNKHMGDGLRFRNKLVYDLLESIPQLMAARTSFVHLYVKDETQGENGPYVDYGLYTQVEQINKRYLRNHGLDTNGHLYKINYFEFYEYEDIVVNEDDPRYVKNEFEKYIESKGNSDHTKLINLLKKINDKTVSADELLEYYFDEENVAYWMACMILLGNKDTQSRNMFIYSPYNSLRWYFIPWDNDSSLTGTEREVRKTFFGEGWERGISNYWGNMLFRKLLKSERFRIALDNAVNDLRNNYIKSDVIVPVANSYAEIVKKYLSAVPDGMHPIFSPEQYEYVLASIPDELQRYYQEYKESLNWPMPFFIGTPYIKDGKLILSWENSYDLADRDITYDVYLSNSLDFEGAFFKKLDTVETKIEVDALPLGQYFLKVIARNSDGFEQFAFDYYLSDIVEEIKKEYGVKAFYVNADGTIVEEEYVE